MLPKYLLLAPVAVWATAGLVLLIAPHRALDYFPYLWVANDISIFLAFAGVMLTVFRPGSPERPPVDEWSTFKPIDPDALRLEDLLLEVARRAEREAPPM